MTRVIITGGLGVLGAAVVQAFIAAGHTVAILDHAPAPVGSPLTVIGDIDLANPEAANMAVGAAAEHLGGVDVLVNLAGAFEYAPLLGGDPAVWSRLFTANLLTCANVCRAAARRLTEGGAIINVGATAASAPSTGMAPYAASKAGVACLTQSLADELGGRIRVNAVLPRTLDTPRNRLDMPDVDPADWTSVEAVAAAIVFLASPQAKAINGALVPVSNPTRLRTAP